MYIYITHVYVSYPKTFCSPDEFHSSKYYLTTKCNAIGMRISCSTGEIAQRGILHFFIVDLKDLNKNTFICKFDLRPKNQHTSNKSTCILKVDFHP